MTGQRSGSPNQTIRSASAGADPADAAAPSGRAWNSTRGIRPVAVTRTFTIWTDSSGFSWP